VPGWKYEPVFEPVEDEGRSRFATLLSVAVKSGLAAIMGGYLVLTVFVYVKTGRFDLVVRPNDVAQILKTYR
jgi:hypothetical protein